MIATAFMSMWISNTATAVMMLQSAMAIVSQLRDNPVTIEDENKILKDQLTAILLDLHSKMTEANKAELTLLFDGGCPICCREVKFLKLMDPDVIPPNLIIRISSHIVLYNYIVLY